MRTAYFIKRTLRIVLTNHNTKLQLRFPVVILASMNELEDAWSQMLVSKLENARAAGRDDVADYLALKQLNDAIRQASVGWLFDAFIEVASEATGQNPSITIEREDPHEFEFRRGKMAGGLVRVRFGVRAMTVEAGWPRTPAHGFMRGGALAAARIVHFGMPAAGTELVLIRERDTPVWNSTDGSGFDSQKLREQFAILLGT
jgi:hypothetical protein